MQDIYVFTAHNKDYAMGNYYSEDDWYIVAYSDDLNALSEKVARLLVSSGIAMEDWDLCVISGIVTETGIFLKVEDGHRHGDERAGGSR